MTRIVLSLAILATTFALSLPAQAQLTRTFVSSAGSDSNPCTIAQPCATFAHAYSLVAANGIVAALDPGKYGPLTNIATGVTINGNGWAAITAPAQGNGITVNAVAATVTLIGLEIDGAQAAYNGIVLNSAGSFTVTNCTLQNFVQDNNHDSTTGNGILMQPTSGTLNFVVTNTTASNNANSGIVYSTSGSPNANGAIDHVVTSNDVGAGIIIDTFAAPGGSFVGTISNSIVTDSPGNGIAVANNAATFKLSIDGVSISGNGNGLGVNENSTVLLGRSVITGNGIGVLNGTNSNTVYTYKDNRINLNGTDISSPLNMTFAQQ